jgi:prevent-host-death family protein
MANLDRELTASQLRDQLTDVVSSVAYGHDRVGITRHGKLVAVVVSVDDLDRLEQLEDAADIRACEEAKANDDGTRVSADELFAELGM